MAIDTRDDSYRVSTDDIEGAVKDLLSILARLSIGFTHSEYEIQAMLADLLTEHGINHQKEYRLGPRNRIDFYTDQGIGIEVKRGRPNKAQLLRQLERYTSFKEIRAVVLVLDRNVNIPSEIKGKSCIVFGLNRLWGVALG